MPKDTILHSTPVNARTRAVILYRNTNAEAGLPVYDTEPKRRQAPWPMSLRPSAASSVLYRDDAANVIVLDLPLSIEEAQVPAGETQTRRLVSSEPALTPFEAPEPRDGVLAVCAGSTASQIADLMTAAAVNSALDHLCHAYDGTYCLPRVTEAARAKRSELYIPPKAQYLQGTIQDMRDQFLQSAPKFDLILMDPPWPNRSARRNKQSYQTASTIGEIRDLLEQIPVPVHLAPDGLVAVWITNKPAVFDLMTGPVAGLFSQWGLELAAEWTWLKCTASGEPLLPLDSHWRKPWEKLLIAKRRGSPTPSTLRHCVLLAVPDIHSRKPSVKGLFDQVFGRAYTGLEVFARTLTAGWWSWGNEVLQFQQSECWIIPTDAA